MVCYTRRLVDEDVGGTMYATILHLRKFKHCKVGVIQETGVNDSALWRVTRHAIHF